MMTASTKPLIFEEIEPQLFHLKIQEESRNVVNMLVDYLEIVAKNESKARDVAVMLDMCAIQTLPLDQLAHRIKHTKELLDPKAIPNLKLAIVYTQVTPFIHAISSFLRNFNPSRVTVYFYDCNASYQAWDWLKKD